MGGLFYLQLGLSGFWIGFLAPPVTLLALFAGILYRLGGTNTSISLNEEAITFAHRTKTKKLHWNEIVSANIINTNIWPNILILKGTSLTISVNFNLVSKRVQLVRALRDRIPSNLDRQVDWSKIA